MAHPADADDTIPMRPDARARLNACEQAVLTASATGLVVAEVAEALDLTPEAVHAALRSTIMKLGARSKLEVVVIAFQMRLIDRPGQ